MILKGYQKGNDPIIDNIIDDYTRTLYINSVDLSYSTRFRDMCMDALTTGNLGCAYRKANGGIEKYIAHSGFNNSKKLKFFDMFKPEYTVAYRPELIGRTNLFEVKTLDKDCVPTLEIYPRYDDTESKILEEISHNYDIKGFTGREDIVLWTDRYPCPSCRCVILAFEKKYNTTITVYYRYRIQSNPCDKGVGCP